MTATVIRVVAWDRAAGRHAYLGDAGALAAYDGLQEAQARLLADSRHREFAGR